MTLRDKVIQKFKVYGVPVTTADCQFVYKMLHKRLLFTCGWVERYLEDRNIERGKESTRAADRLLQRWRQLRLIKFDRGYWSWTQAGKDLVL